MVASPTAVAACNEEHRRTVNGGAADNSNSHADAARADVMRVLVAAKRSPGVIVVVAILIVPAVLRVVAWYAAAVEGETTNKRDGGVDIRHEGSDAGVGMVIEVRAAGVECQVESINEVGVDIGLCDSSDIARLAGVVVRGKVSHDDVLAVDVEAVGNPQREVGENLGNGCHAGNDEVVVERIEETNLDERGIRWLRRRVSVWKNQLGHAGGYSSFGSGWRAR